MEPEKKSGTTEKDWQAAGGAVCPICHRETVRLLAYGYTRKACPECVQRRARILAHRQKVIREH